MSENILKIFNIVDDFQSLIRFNEDNIELLYNDFTVFLNVENDTMLIKTLSYIIEINTKNNILSFYNDRIHFLNNKNNVTLIVDDIITEFDKILMVDNIKFEKVDYYNEFFKYYINYVISIDGKKILQIVNQNKATSYDIRKNVIYFLYDDYKILKYTMGIVYLDKSLDEVYNISRIEDNKFLFTTIVNDIDFTILYYYRNNIWNLVQSSITIEKIKLDEDQDLTLNIFYDKDKDVIETTIRNLTCITDECFHYREDCYKIVMYIKNNKLYYTQYDDYIPFTDFKHVILLFEEEYENFMIDEFKFCDN